MTVQFLRSRRKYGLQHGCYLKLCQSTRLTIPVTGDAYSLVWRVYSERASESPGEYDVSTVIFIQSPRARSMAMHLDRNQIKSMYHTEAGHFGGYYQG